MAGSQHSKSKKSKAQHSVTNPTSHSLLKLPPELQQEIFSYVLPRNLSPEEYAAYKAIETDKPELIRHYQDYYWKAGYAALFTVSREISEIAIHYVYSRSCFYHCGRDDQGRYEFQFDFSYSPLKPGIQSRSFPDRIVTRLVAPRNTARMTNIRLNVTASCDDLLGDHDLWTWRLQREIVELVIGDVVGMMDMFDSCAEYGYPQVGMINYTEMWWGGWGVDDDIAEHRMLVRHALSLLLSLRVNGPVHIRGPKDDDFRRFAAETEAAIVARPRLPKHPLIDLDFRIQVECYRFLISLGIYPMDLKVDQSSPKEHIRIWSPADTAQCFVASNQTVCCATKGHEFHFLAFEHEPVSNPEVRSFFFGVPCLDIMLTWIRSHRCKEYYIEIKAYNNPVRKANVENLVSLMQQAENVEKVEVDVFVTGFDGVEYEQDDLEDDDVHDLLVCMQPLMRLQRVPTVRIGGTLYDVNWKLAIAFAKMMQKKEDKWYMTLLRAYAEPQR
ncbi:MAG: hypothetical protein M1820_000078 [Bogoriella megaspora]|nr:MAG: hypothetical protein M1820_000078 [Bogoriella megaspora]